MVRKYDRLDLMTGKDQPVCKYTPEGKNCGSSQFMPNKGLISFEEKRPVDPYRSAETMHVSHRGGLTSHRTEHY